MNLANTIISRYLFWYTSWNVYFRYRNCICVSALLAAISDIAHPQWRATSLGVYRFWRDLGFVIGALGIGSIADFFGINIAIQLAG